MRALWVIGPAMIVLSVVVSAYVQSIYNSSVRTQDQYILPSIIQSVSSGFSTVGWLTIIGLLFLHAVRWRREP